MAKCDCYYQHGMKFLCYGTKEMEECSCGGDTSKCNFYPEKRKPKVQKMVNKKLLIDVEQAKRATYEEVFWTESEQAVVRNFLAKLPKVDAVEVVRCKDCVSFGVYECTGNGYCRHYKGLVDPKPYDFCSYGERKDNG